MFPTNPSAHPIIHPIMQMRVLDVRLWAILPLGPDAYTTAARRCAPESQKIRDGRARVPTRRGGERSRKPYRVLEARHQNSKTPNSESNPPSPCPRGESGNGA